MLRKNLLYIAFFWGISTSVSGQDIVDLIRFDSATQVTINGERVQKLYNARLGMRDVIMICDSAYRFIDRNEMRAFGNIQIDTDTETIWADTVIYFNDRDVSLLRGRVIIKQDSTTLFGNKVDYDFESKIGVFTDNIRLEDPNGVLTALSGIYYQTQDSAEFRHQVQLQDTSQYIEGDSLFINREREYVEIYSNVFAFDSTNQSILTGEYLEADSTGRRYAKENAYLMNIEEDSAQTDTMHIFAHELLLLDQDTTSIIRGFKDVVIWDENFSSLSDSLEYDSELELFELGGTPKAWHKEIQLNGPYIFVQLDSNQVKELKAFHKAFAVQRDTVTGRLHQLKGDTLFAFFDAGEIYEINLYPNSQLLYHTKNDENEPDGAMENSSPETILLFEDGELVQARMGQNQGLFLPEYTDLVNRTLDGFSWNPDLRPIKPTFIPAPRWEPIPVERPFELPMRYRQFLEALSED